MNFFEKIRWGPGSPWGQAGVPWEAHGFFQKLSKNLDFYPNFPGFSTTTTTITTAITTIYILLVVVVVVAVIVAVAVVAVVVVVDHV